MTLKTQHNVDHYATFEPVTVRHCGQGYGPYERGRGKNNSQEKFPTILPSRT